MQTMFFQVLQQCSSSAVNNALGRTGGTRGVQDLTGVIEGEIDEFNAVGID